MTMQDAQKVDGSAEHREIHTVVTSSQHVEPLKAVRSKEVAGHSSLEKTDPSAEVELQKTCDGIPALTVMTLRRVAGEMCSSTRVPARGRWSSSRQETHPPQFQHIDKKTGVPAKVQ